MFVHMFDTHTLYSVGVWRHHTMCERYPCRHTQHQRGYSTQCEICCNENMYHNPLFDLNVYREVIVLVCRCKHVTVYNINSVHSRQHTFQIE